MAPDQVLTMSGPNMAAWSANVRGGATLQPVSEKNIGAGYPSDIAWRPLYPEV